MLVDIAVVHLDCVDACTNLHKVKFHKTIHPYINVCKVTQIDYELSQQYYINVNSLGFDIVQQLYTNLSLG